MSRRSCLSVVGGMTVDKTSGSRGRRWPPRHSMSLCKNEMTLKRRARSSGKACSTFFSERGMCNVFELYAQAELGLMHYEAETDGKDEHLG